MAWNGFQHTAVMPSHGDLSYYIAHILHEWILSSTNAFEGRISRVGRVRFSVWRNYGENRFTVTEVKMFYFSQSLQSNTGKLLTDFCSLFLGLSFFCLWEVRHVLPVYLPTHSNSKPNNTELPMGKPLRRKLTEDPDKRNELLRTTNQYCRRDLMIARVRAQTCPPGNSTDRQSRVCQSFSAMCRHIFYLLFTSMALRGNKVCKYQIYHFRH